MNATVFLAMLTLFTSSQLYAQIATLDNQTVPKEDYAYIKEKLKLSLHTEFGVSHQSENQKSPNKLNDFTQFYLPSIGWNFKKDFFLLVSSEIKYASVDGTAKFPNRFYRGLISLTKSEILSEKDDGVKLNLGVARRYFDQISYPVAYGNTRIIVTLAKTMGITSLVLPVTYLQNDPKDTTDLELWRHTLELTPDLSFKITDKLTLSINDDFLYITPWNNKTLKKSAFTHDSYGTASYQFTDMFSSTGQFHYVHNQIFNANDSSDTLGFLVSSGVNTTKNTSISLEMGSVFFESSDQKTLASSWNKPDFTVYFDWAF